MITYSIEVEPEMKNVMFLKCLRTKQLKNSTKI